MLPVGPPGAGNSPYSSPSAFAGSPLLVSLEELFARGLLRRSELRGSTALPRDRVDYAAAARFREARLRAAYARFATGDRRERARFDEFRSRCGEWLDDFALFRALKRETRGAPWTRWDQGLRARGAPALATARRSLADEVRYHEFVQYAFDRQWSALRRRCHELGIGLIGDIPIFVAHDSADVWAHQDLFHLDERGRPKRVAGIPPDYFSRTGQLWGNPLYRWDRLRRRGYDWWLARLRTTFDRFEVVRLDHFIGFLRTWEVSGRARTAIRGRWGRGPGADFFTAVRKRLGRVPLIAEDLGVVIPAVKTLRDRFGLPGMRVLQFAFGNDPEADNYRPHNYPRRCVVYTGTHDNDTTVGWFRDQGSAASTRSRAEIERERAFTLRYLASTGPEIHWDLIRLANMSVAHTVIVMAQDALGLGSEARMNRPGIARGNWEWRLPTGAPSAAVRRRLADLARTYGRAY